MCLRENGHIESDRRPEADKEAGLFWNSGESWRSNFSSTVVSCVENWIFYAVRKESVNPYNRKKPKLQDQRNFECRIQNLKPRCWLSLTSEESSLLNMQVQPNQTVNQQFCFQVLAKSQEEIKKSTRNWWNSCWVPHWNTPVYKSISECQFFLIEKQIPTFRNASYSPDLALCDLSLSQIENCFQRNPFSVNWGHPWEDGWLV